MKKAFYYLFFLCLLFSIGLRVDASNRIKSIDMDIYIDRNGNASVKEVWNTYLDSGTEGYKTISKMGNSYLNNFRVIDDTGRSYNYIGSWNTSLDFDSKSYKNGINYVSDGLELCWGISNYGDRTYTLSYNINNFKILFGSFNSSLP